MKYSSTIKINFRGGIISPGELYNILMAVGRAGVTRVRFGLRQQLLLDVLSGDLPALLTAMEQLDIHYEVNGDAYPNVVSSYPAEDVFISNTWLSEGVYKDIFDAMDYRPRLKINVSDSNQAFTPLLTGNINWVASLNAPHFWHLFIRFPKTNTVYEWEEMVYTNDIARISQQLEEQILGQRQLFYDNPFADGSLLLGMIREGNYITRRAADRAKLPPFNLPYYEGLNRYNNKYWLGIYRRDELFEVGFLKALCRLCLQTRIGQLCTTPWKSLVVKSIEEKDKPLWNRLLAKHQVNMRHAANELNFQVEDNCRDGLQLKNYLVRKLNNNDTRTFGICIGIKTRKKTEVFSSILIRRKPLLSIFGLELLPVYDILCAKDFNPNERTGWVFSSNNPKFLLAEQLRRAILAFQVQQSDTYAADARKQPRQQASMPQAVEYVYQCRHCMTVYDNTAGEPERGIAPGLQFEALPENYCCPLCESPKSDFNKMAKTVLGLQAI
jgi:rubredoxin